MTNINIQMICKRISVWYSRLEALTALKPHWYDQVYSIHPRLNVLGHEDQTGLNIITFFNFII